MEDLCHDLYFSFSYVSSSFQALKWRVPSHFANSSNQLLSTVMIALYNLPTINYYFIFSLVILVGWISLVLYATFSSSSVNILSLHTSIEELFKMRKRGSRLNVLDLFRVVAICWVVTNHLGSEGRLDVLDRLPSAQIFKQAVHNHPVFGALLGNSSLGVEIFLVLSGLLAAKSWSLKADSPFKKHCFSFLMRRWFRITPIMAVFVFLATGPLTKSVLPKFHCTMVSSCTFQSIIFHLTLTSNWQETPTCLGYLWYLGLDMQLYITAPFLLHLLQRCLKTAIATFIFLISLSALLRAVYCQIYEVCNSSDVDIPFISFPGQDPVTTKAVYTGLWEMYSRPYTKCAPFLIGLLVGYWMSKEEMHVRISPENARLLFFTALLGALGMIYGILPEYWYPDQGNTLYNTLYTALFRTIFAACIATMIMALFSSTKNTEISRHWTVAAKLTFNVYLLHMPVVYLFNHVQAFQEVSSALGLLAAVPFALLLSFGVALLFYCFVESPLSRLSKKVLQQVKL